MNNLVLSALEAIPARECDYLRWTQIGMALKQEGYDVDVWEQWSTNDTRYHKGECQKKWRSFGGSANPVTAGSILEMAKKYGWSPAKAFKNNGVMEWDDVINDDYEQQSSKKLSPSAEQLKTYIKTLFNPDEYVAYCVKSFKGDDGKYRPSGEQVFSRTAEQLIKQLDKHPEDIGATVGDWDPQAGAWIRFNPFDGNGIKDENIVAYRYALVESDNMPIDKQYEMYMREKLPIAALVKSGKKSLHAIVRIDAENKDEYRERVAMLYETLEAHGLEIDRQNKNPSRLSRMPGVTRGEQIQELVATNIGSKSWGEWVDLQSGHEPLPEIVSLFDAFQNPLPLAEPLIEGVLRQGHKMLLQSASKAGKSFALMELAIAIAHGSKWLGAFQCRQGKVLYINLEIDPASFQDRFVKIFDALDFSKESEEVRNISIWNLRGRARPLDELVPEINKRIDGQGYKAVIIDPIYKIIMGDENSASDMGKFCNQFDKICERNGCSAIYAHHYSKGAQGAKKAQDRSSGSGVFARDPDTIFDMCQIDTSSIGGMGFDDEIGCDNDTPAPAFRVECSLREFANPKPLNIWFRYPIHELDEDGTLENALIEGEARSNLAKSPKRQKNAEVLAQLDEVYDDLLHSAPDGLVHLSNMAIKFDLASTSMRRILNQLPDRFKVKNGIVGRLKSELD